MENYFMTKRDELLDLLDQIDEIHSAKSYKIAIENHPTLLQSFQEMTKIQQQLVRETLSPNNQQAIHTRKQLELKMQELQEHPTVSSFLLLLEELQSMADAIQDIINQELNEE
jgi:cell fate (sporulation/competence/biofilm development) regulator YlbF (YheA/YmcA/DUF963 family)